MDRRWHQVADILVNYSTGVQPGEQVMIAMHEVETLPLVRAVYEAAVRAGANVQVQFLSEYLRHSLLRWGSRAQIGWVPAMEAQGMEWADVYLGLRGAHNLHELADADPSGSLLALNQEAMGKVSALRWQKTRWCLLRVPNEALAWQAKTDVETITELFFAATLRDWRAESAQWNQAAGLLQRGDRVHLVARDTDLRFSTNGRRWIVADGHNNLPDGEIMTAPVVDTVDGFIAFELPAVLGGRLVEGMRLEWRSGVLISASARTNQDFLHQILASDPGASRLGEFAIGTNYGLDRFCHDILFDEKVGGTVHIALGRSYPQCGGDNMSAIHWDLVKDTRAEGSAIYLDGRLIFERGQFV